MSRDPSGQADDLPWEPLDQGNGSTRRDVTEKPRFVVRPRASDGEGTGVDELHRASDTEEAIEAVIEVVGERFSADAIPSHDRGRDPGERGKGEAKRSSAQDAACIHGHEGGRGERCRRVNPYSAAPTSWKWIVSPTTTRPTASGSRPWRLVAT